MAHFKSIPIVRITRNDTEKLHDYVITKYSFSKMNEALAFSALEDLKYLEFLDNVTDVDVDKDDSEQAKQFILKLLKDNQALVEKVIEG